MKRLLALLAVFLLAACVAQPRTVVFNQMTYQIQSTAGGRETYRAAGGDTLLVERGAASTLITVGGQACRIRRVPRVGTAGG